MLNICPFFLPLNTIELYHIKINITYGIKEEGEKKKDFNKCEFNI